MSEGFSCSRCGNRTGNGQCVCMAGVAQGQAMAAANQRAGVAAQMNQAAGQAAQNAASLGQQASALIDREKTRELLERVQLLSPKPQTPDRLAFVRDFVRFLGESEMADDDGLMACLLTYVLQGDDQLAARLLRHVVEGR